MQEDGSSGQPLAFPSAFDIDIGYIDEVNGCTERY